MMTLPEAEQHYQQILVTNPKQAPVWCLLGETRLRLAKLPEAAAAYQNALRLEPGSADGHFGLANVCKEQGKRMDAIGCYQRGLEFAPEHALTGVVGDAKGTQRGHKRDAKGTHARRRPI